MKRHLLALLVLLLAVAALLPSCSFSMLNPKEINTHMDEILNALARDDGDAFYAMLYKPSASEEEIRETFRSMREYFPVTADYHKVRTSLQSHQSVGTNSGTTWAANYTVTFSERTFYLYVVYFKGTSGSGFQTFNVVSQEDYDQYHGKEVG